MKHTMRLAAAGLLCAWAASRAIAGDVLEAEATLIAVPTPIEKAAPASVPAAGLDAALEPAALPAAPSASASSSPRTFLEMIQATRRIVSALEATPAGAATSPVAASELEAMIDRLAQWDQQLTAEENKGRQRHWSWKPAPQFHAGEEDVTKEQFVIDPPLKNGAAVAFQCKKNKVRIDRVKVIDDQARSTEFPFHRSFSAGDEQENCYLYYPAAISKIVIFYASRNDAKSRVTVWAGTTDLPEYGKEAIYWDRLALRELRGGDANKAAEYLKQAMIKLYLYRVSRGRE